MTAKGTVWKFGDHVNTDDIIAARYLNVTDRKVLASHCMETLDADFPRKVKRADIIVAGENFGCGSSREHAPVAIQAAGVSAVVARSFARIFLRNCINIGLPAIETPDADKIPHGTRLQIDFEKGQIRDLSSGKTFTFPAYPEFLQQIIHSGGLMKWVKEKRIASE